MDKGTITGGEARKKKRSGRYKFSNKKNPVKGIISIIIGVVTFINIIVTSYISSLSHGNGNLILGLSGVISMILCIVGIVLGIKSIKEKDIYYTIPLFGLAINGILFVGYFILYIIGLG